MANCFAEVIIGRGLHEQRFGGVELIGHVLYNIFRGISAFIQIAQLILVAYCLASWVLSPANRFYEVLRNLAWPIIAPFRGISEWLMTKIRLPIDLSAIIALFALNIAENLIWRVYSLFRFIL